jgi:hypothetical protein
MSMAGGLTGVTIQYLTFDGNRPNMQTCTPGPPSGPPDAAADLDLSYAGLVTVENVNFINAPWDALWLGGSESSPTNGASYVAFSNFGAGFYSSGYSETAQQTATRWTAAFLFSSYTGAYQNSMNYAGTAAITMHSDFNNSGLSQYVGNNSINNNRYEQPDGTSGGQIFVTDTTTYPAIYQNTINGNYWYTNLAQDTNPMNPYDVRCLPSSGLWSHGIEGGATGFRYYNNQIEQNIGFGIFVEPPAGVTYSSGIISGYDPFPLCQGCTAVNQYVQNNGACAALTPACYTSPTWPAYDVIAGINVHSASGSVTNLTLDHIRSINNYKYGVSMYGVTGTPGFTDSQNSGVNYACITGNVTGPLNSSGFSSDSPGYNSFTNSCP